MKIGFLNNQIDGRGTGNAVFNYAHYNEEILGNQSKIFTFPDSKHNPTMVNRFVGRFGEIHIPTIEGLKDCDALYHIKSGENSGQRFSTIPYLVHAVFNADPHGDKYAVVSEWMGNRDKLPFVPHIVEHPDGVGNLREVFGIPDTATVFGRIGGYDSFDIPWVWDAMKAALELRDDIWFVFINTAPELKHERILYYPETLNPIVKKGFINSCDAMLHARERGETFGISVGEFSILGKPIFTYDGSYEKAHYFELKGTAKRYKDQTHLMNLLYQYHREPEHPFYTRFPPDKVMEKFKEVFLD